MPIIECANRCTWNLVYELVYIGVSGLLLKPVPGNSLVQAILTVLVGETAFCSEAHAAAFESLRRSATGLRLPMLSTRERQVSVCLVRGFCDKEIALALGIGPGTVHSHLAKLYRKLCVHDRSEAVRTLLGLRT